MTLCGSSGSPTDSGGKLTLASSSTAAKFFAEHSWLSDSLTPTNGFVFQHEKKLTSNLHYSVSVNAGTPSEEGPRTTPSSQNFGFYTYPTFE